MLASRAGTLARRVSPLSIRQLDITTEHQGIVSQVLYLREFPRMLSTNTLHVFIVALYSKR